MIHDLDFLFIVRIAFWKDITFFQCECLYDVTKMENYICMILLEQKKKRASRMSKNCTVVNFVSIIILAYFLECVK